MTEKLDLEARSAEGREVILSGYSADCFLLLEMVRGSATVSIGTESV